MSEKYIKYAKCEINTIIKRTIFHTHVSKSYTCSVISSLSMFVTEGMVPYSSGKSSSNSCYIKQTLMQVNNEKDGINGRLL